MLSLLFILLLLHDPLHSQSITQLAEITIDEELPIGSVVTFLTDKIPHLDQSIEYDLVSPSSSEFDLFTIDHRRQAITLKKRLDFEELARNGSCHLSVSIAVSHLESINVYILPIAVKNIDDHRMAFAVNRTVIEIVENDSQWKDKSYPLPRAMDKDNDPIEYTVHLHNWNSPDGLFAYQSSTHRLRPLRSFDREEQSVYLLRLVAHQRNQMDLSIDIIVLIQDQNDHRPHCSPRKFLLDQTDQPSIYRVNATDEDQGDNARLEYRFVPPIPSGFDLDATSGEIRFDPKKWKRNRSMKFLVNVTDHGHPIRLSSECLIEFESSYRYQIDFISSNDPIRIDDLRQAFGHLQIRNLPEKNLCFDCSIRLNSSMDDFFDFNPKTFEFNLNPQSIVLRRILSNERVEEEIFVMNIDVEVADSKKNFTWTFLFNKQRIRQASRMIFLSINEDVPVQTALPFHSSLPSCFTTDFRLIDQTETFDLDDEKSSLILQKPLNVHFQQYYHLSLKSTTSKNTTDFCSIVELHLTVLNLYSLYHVYPYFSQTFFHLNEQNLSEFRLPFPSSSISYRSSRSNELLIDPLRRTIRFQSPLTSSEIRLDLFNNQTPSLSCSIAIRLYSSLNRSPPRLLLNRTSLTIDQSIYQFEAIDPDLPFDLGKGLFPPSVEFAIETSRTDLFIDRYTGRLFIKSREHFQTNITLILQDFGQPTRLTHRELLQIDFHPNSNERLEEIPLIMSNVFLIIGSSLLIFILLIFILILITRVQSKTKTPPTPWKNFAPPETCLIDCEYGTQVQRIYPTVTNDRIPTHLSIHDINKYLERFEKIYHSSTEQTSTDPIGSVV